MNLRPYQLAMVSKIREAYAAGSNSVLAVSYP